MEFTKEELYTVSIWIKLPGLDFKYWNQKGLSKIGSLVGKPLMVDQNTERKIRLNFARLLVEVDMDAKLPDTILFRSEKGHVVEQKVTYDWKPTLCQYCRKHGHSEEICRKKNPPPKPIQKETEKRGPKEPKIPAVKTGATEEPTSQISKQTQGKSSNVLQEVSTNLGWTTTGRIGKGQQNKGQAIESSNSFQVLNKLDTMKINIAEDKENVRSQIIPRAGDG
ncbi:uncharacterized protein LOC107784572 [Nicotiana tabacum]|uniref:Uncharacterized protein LOC107784572 n=1 Tax=Nicotiana tabacum TaxID=4097 RepID=A0A1S3Z9Z7_TOBAC|nr:PREDICTED: uncharacterized protein LOC107784572 [Nicotiana tabacum]